MLGRVEPLATLGGDSAPAPPSQCQDAMPLLRLSCLNRNSAGIRLAMLAMARSVSHSVFGRVAMAGWQL